jgi:hypothetical protein
MTQQLDKKDHSTALTVYVNLSLLLSVSF